MRSKEQLPLIIGIAIPVIVTVAVGLSVWIPTLYAPKPMYDFLYSVNDGYAVDQQYVVENEHLVKRKLPATEVPIKSPPPVYPAILYYYDAKSDTSKQISFEDAKKYALNAGVISPDGFEITSGDRSEGIFPALFGGVQNDYQSRYLRGHGAAYKLNLAVSSMDYYSFRFLGWIIPS